MWIAATFKANIIDARPRKILNSRRNMNLMAIKNQYVYSARKPQQNKRSRGLHLTNQQKNTSENSLIPQDRSLMSLFFRDWKTKHQLNRVSNGLIWNHPFIEDMISSCFGTDPSSNGGRWYQWKISFLILEESFLIWVVKLHTSFIFTPKIWGRWIQIWRSYSSDELKQPPTRDR